MQLCVLKVPHMRSWYVSIYSEVMHSISMLIITGFSICFHCTGLKN